MNGQSKMAIFIAPFLVVGGYIAADYYAQEQAKSKNLFELSLEGHCNLAKNPCILKNKQLTLMLSNKNDITIIESNHPLEEVMLSVVDKDNKENRYQMKSDQNRQFWQAETQLSSLLQQSSKLKMRLISIVNKGYYFSEFYSSEY